MRPVRTASGAFFVSAPRLPSLGPLASGARGRYLRRMSGLLDGVRMVEGDLDAKGLRFAIVVSRFNAFVTERLLEGAVDVLRRSGVKAEDIAVYRTPGSYELPMVASRVAERGGVDAILALGCLIRGDTIHFDLIAAEAAKGLAQVGMSSNVPVVFGVLTTDTLEQSVNRAGAKQGNKGGEAAFAAIEQARLYAAIASESQTLTDTGKQNRGGRAQGRELALCVLCHLESVAADERAESLERLWREEEPSRPERWESCVG